ncbi:MAG: multifunctional oxoglutarate decarboxylase/oxoglutarate dehydrogenase thiamine pyrophosphate-binding subunit/dihydrolipoyllysine-residue succinyltransferase subunit [Acidimicrobiia bacterium]
MTFDEAGPNEGLVEDLYEQYRENPSAVPEHWRVYFAAHGDGTGNGRRTPGGVAAPDTPAAPAASAAPTAPAGPAPATPDAPATDAVGVAATPAPAVDTTEPLRGVRARIVENMEASLGVPTATSVRSIPAKLLEVNRAILNNHLGRTGRNKVSFTHLIAFAVTRALRDFPNLSSSYEEVDGTPTIVRRAHVNLGLAVDVERPDGSRTLLVPNIKQADTLDFAGFWTAYEALIAKVRAQQMSVDDFAGTTGSITNPGMIGTVHSVPRLMPSQAFILGVGAIGFPTEYEGADPQTVAQMGISTITTLTNTYDHRIIGGAESGEFLRRIHDLLLGDDDFYDEVFRSLAVPYEPARWVRDHAALDPASVHDKVVKVHTLINMYRVRGHLLANLDPLGRRDPSTHPELDITHYGLSIWDLDREFPIGSLGAGQLGRTRMTLRDILGVLRDAYARTVGVEYMHIQEPDQKDWIQERVEIPVPEPGPEEKRQILDRLNAAEAFERFVHTKYLGQKRFSLEGAETLIPMLDALASSAADAGIAELVMGMAHRGRLNVLAGVVGKSYSQIFREFEGELDPTSTQGSGDVKYHLGARGKHRSPAGNKVKLTLAANPSHLEAVDPVVEGMARAKGDRLGDATGAAVLPVLIHGDAAFAGQGVVAETLNLSEVDGYDVGGTVHVVVNNQLGFTTSPESGRSSVYPTDVAKMVQAPIFHVNGDDPEAAVRVMRLAFDFRQRFNKDVVVDLFCYRRYGHNEGDEPAFTQPGMYALIDALPSVRELYTQQLVAKGDLTVEECEAAAADFRARLDRAFEETHTPHETGLDTRGPTLDALSPGEPAEPAAVQDAVATAVTPAALERVVAALEARPEGFSVHPKLERVLQANRLVFQQGEVDWALAEACALGTLLLDGTPVRLSGQDTRRGTFSQRHGVIVDHVTESEYVPLAHIAPDQAPFRLYDSVLSEYAALGFDYGYSVADPRSFVAWEAQFGDFMNGAQVIIDQFLVAASDKWAQDSALALLLPHGFEGQGPEHSSARIERFLVLCAEDNLRVAYPSTAAQYFHLLRRQSKSPRRVPLICFTPKRYLRMAQSRSPVSELTNGCFRPVLDDRSAPTLDANAVQRVLVCTGKVSHELMDARDERRAPIAVVSVEQLYPWPEPELLAVLERYPQMQQLWWVQEEPANMGAWTFAHTALLRIADHRSADLRHVARRSSASPASGSIKIHEREQAELLAAALG